MGLDSSSVLRRGQSNQSRFVHVSTLGTRQAINRPHLLCSLCCLWYAVLQKFLKKNFTVVAPVVNVRGNSFHIRPEMPDNGIHLKFLQRGIVTTRFNNGDTRITGLGDLAGDSTKIDYKRIDYMKHLAGQIFGKEVIQGAFNEWSGLRPCTPDDNPLVGMISCCNNAILNIGHGGRGMTRGFATSKFVSDGIDG